MKFMRPKDLAGEILDMGTGSGVFPFLLRKMGANDITATDVCPHAIKSALKMNVLNSKIIKYPSGPVIYLWTSGPRKNPLIRSHSIRPAGDHHPPHFFNVFMNFRRESKQLPRQCSSAIV